MRRSEELPRRLPRRPRRPGTAPLLGGRPGAAALALALARCWACGRGNGRGLSLVFAEAAGQGGDAQCSCEGDASGADDEALEPPLEVITPHEVEEAQFLWAEGFLKLTERCLEDPAGARRLATEFVERAYAFGLAGREVLVRPAKETAKPFRRTVPGVVASLVGGSAEFPEDDVGMAHGPWTSLRFENAGISVEGPQGLAMGQALLNDTNGNITALDYTMGYIRDPMGKVRLNLFFLSAPFEEANNATQCTDISPDDVHAAIEDWGSSVVSIGQRYARRWDYFGRTMRFLQTSFDFPSQYGTNGEWVEVDPNAQRGPAQVLFKPADSARPHFRTTLEEAQAYFIGDQKNFPKDIGFALRNWKTFDFVVAGTILRPKHAWAMGEYEFEDFSGYKVAGQFTFGFIRQEINDDVLDEAGKALRITVLHMSHPHDGVKLDWHDLGRREVTYQSVEEAQERWGRLIAEVGAGYRSASQLVDGAFAYTFRPTFFRPAEAEQNTSFRFSRAGAISYYAGGNERFAEDWGFATRPWSAARMQTEDLVLYPGQALALGHLFYEAATGVRRKAQFAASYVADQRGVLKLNLFHEAFSNDSAAEALAQQAQGFLALEENVASAPVSLDQVQHYQDLWAQAVVRVGEASDNQTVARERAKELVDKMYGFSEGPVLFKPTEANAETRIRVTRAGVVAYFAGGDPMFPADRGFARRPWVAIRFENRGTLAAAGMVTVMGDFFLTDTEGVEVQLEYTMNYFRDVDGRLRMNVHHVSFPYDATVNSTWDGVASGLAGAMGSFGWAVSGGATGAGTVGSAAFFGFGSGVRQGASHFRASMIVPILFCAGALGSLAYFTCFWHKHAASTTQGSGVLASFTQGFEHLQDGSWLPSGHELPHDPFQSQEVYPQYDDYGQPAPLAHASYAQHDAGYSHHASAYSHHDAGYSHADYGYPNYAQPGASQSGYGAGAGMYSSAHARGHYAYSS